MKRDVCQFEYDSISYTNVTYMWHSSVIFFQLPIALMLSVTSAIDRPKSVPNYRLIECAFLFSISKFSANAELKLF